VENPQAQSRNPLPIQVSWQAILLLVFNSLMIVLTLVTVLVLVITGMNGFLEIRTGTVSITPIFLLAGGWLLCAVLLLPPTLLALMRVFGKSEEERFHLSEKVQIFGLLVAGLIVLPVTLVLGEIVSRNQQISWFLLPPLHIVAASIPVAWLVFIGLRGLKTGSQLRKWGVFTAGLVYAPNLILVAEATALIVGFFGLVLALSSNPAWFDELLGLGQRLRYSAANPEILRRVLEPYLLHPITILTVFTSVAVIVPLIEETIKPAGLWFLAGKRLTPTQGLTLGLLSGAGYALFENLFLAASDVDWGVTVLARAGTTGIHVLTAGLTGWGLALAWSKGNFLRLGINFSLAVLLHGLWNGLVIFYVGLTIFPDALNSPWSAEAVQKGVLVTLVLLALSAFAAIVGLNWRMQNQEKRDELLVEHLSPELLAVDLSPENEHQEDDSGTLNPGENNRDL